MKTTFMDLSWMLFWVLSMQDILKLLELKLFYEKSTKLEYKRILVTLVKIYMGQSRLMRK